MIVLDASALVEVLIRTPTGQKLEPILQASGWIHAPTVVDAEAASALRALERRRAAPTDRIEAALADLPRLRLRRHPYRVLVTRAWELRRNFTIYDGLYVSLAERIDLPLLTTDRRLARAVRRHTTVPLAKT